MTSILTPFRSIFILCLFLCLSCSSLAQTRAIDSVLTLLKTAKGDTSTVHLYNSLCRYYMVELNDMQKVKEYATKAYKLSELLHYKKGLGYGNFYIGLSHWSKGNLEMALTYLKLSTKLLQEAGVKRAEGACYINIGQIYFELGKLPEARNYIGKGLQLNEELKDTTAMQSGYISIGNIFVHEGNYTQGINNFLKALKLGEAIKDPILVSFANLSIADVFYAQNKFDEALIYYRKALKHLEDIQEQRLAGTINTGIGNVYFKKKQYTEALSYHMKDLKSKTDYGDKQGIAVACNKIGSDYLELRQLQKSLFYQLKALDLFKKIGYKRGLVDACGGVGKAYEEQQEFSKAISYFIEMLQSAKELDYREAIRDAYKNLSSVYAKLKMYEKSLAYTELYQHEKDSLLNKDNFKQVAELNTRYETDKKEKEILLLTKDQELHAKIIKQQQLERWGLIGGLGLLSISIFSIYRRYRFKQKANVLLERQKEEIYQKNLLITDSIDYAHTIQEAVFPSEQNLRVMFPESFILHKPKATVSGDFFWLLNAGDRLICAVADCTGHGVPGAFMSLLGYNMLENATKSTGTTSPAAILNRLDKEIHTRLGGNDFEGISKHGMDISLVSVDKVTNRLEFAAAHNPVYIIRNNELIELKGDKRGIGGTKEEAFNNQTLQLEKGDMIYLFTDGFPDQLGGPKHKKFFYQPFKELLISICSLTPEEQKERIEGAHRLWMGEKRDQTDDILILGIKWM
jgi:serine phosphatase RsbU (regulator of sigma subunit)